MATVVFAVCVKFGKESTALLPLAASEEELWIDTLNELNVQPSISPKVTSILFFDILYIFYC